MTGALSVPDQLRQLNDARKLVLGDVKYYPAVVKGILPIISPTSRLELRRWGADFLCEAFATPALPAGEKETMQPFVLDVLQTVLENPQEDIEVLRSVIQTAASIYPIALRWIIANAYDAITWERMMNIKSRILQIWDNSPPSVKICCIKFAQRVVLAQTSASGTEPRRIDTLDVSLDRVPPNHQVLDSRVLEAEASGLLDRILSVLQDNASDPLLINATLNTLSILVRARPETSNRIINAVLAFNPLQLANTANITPRDRIAMKSMEKTTRMFLIHLSKRDPHNPMAQKIHQHIERMMRAKAETLDDTSRKRLLETQAHDLSESKRQRLALQPPAPAQQQQIPVLGPGPHTLGEVFTLTHAEGLNSFDISKFPLQLVSRINVSTLVGLDNQALLRAVEAVRGRLATISSENPPDLNPNTAPLGVEEDDDDYEPDFYAAEDTEQILNKLDSSPADLSKVDAVLPLETFRLHAPPPLTTEAAFSSGKLAVTQLFDYMKSLDDPTAKKHKAGYNRFAANNRDRDSWVTILIRVATRAQLGLEDVSVKDEGETSTRNAASVSDYIRQMLFDYILDDFRKRIDVAVSWLCEEWYSDRIQAKVSANAPAHYEKWSLKLLDGILPYLSSQDKVLTRFLSEIPELGPVMLSRIKQMCRDPTVVQLALTSLLYLVMMKPPVREQALDTVQDIWSEYEESRNMAGKYLAKYRPAWFAEATRVANSNSIAGGNSTNTTTVA